MSKGSKLIELTAIGKGTGKNGSRFKFRVGLYGSHQEELNEFLGSEATMITTIHGRQILVREKFDEVDRLIEQALLEEDE